MKIIQKKEREREREVACVFQQVISRSSRTTLPKQKQREKGNKIK